MTLPRRLGIALVVLALGAAACGDDTDVTTGPTTTSPTTTSPTTTPSTVPAAPSDITGTITNVAPFVPVTRDCTPPEDLDPNGSVSSDDPPVCTPQDNDILASVLVAHAPGQATGGKIVFTITTDTVLVGTATAPLATFAGLAEGQRVEAWSSGPCAESYPEECTAVAVRRLA